MTAVIYSEHFSLYLCSACWCNGAQVEMKLTGGSSAARKKADRICLRCRRCRALGSQLSTFHNGHFQLGNMGKPELWGYASGGQYLLSLLFCGQLWSSPSSRLVWRPFASWHGKTLSVMGPRMLKAQVLQKWCLGEENRYFLRIQHLGLSSMMVPHYPWTIPFYNCGHKSLTSKTIQW